MEQEKLPKPSRAPATPRRLYLLAAILLALIIATIAYGFRVGQQMGGRFTPLMNAVMEIKIGASNAHIWFNEIISGDQNEDPAKITHFLASAEWHAKALLEGGTNREGTLILIPLRDTVLRQKIGEVRRKLAAFRQLTEKRLAAPGTDRLGSKLDQQYDALFLDFIDEADQVEATLQGLISRNLKRFRQTETTLILACLVLAAILGIAFLRLERQRQESFLAIEEAHRRVATSEKWLNTTMRSMGDAVIATDPAGRITYINPVAVGLTGWQQEEALGEDVARVFHIINEKTREPVDNPVLKVLQKKVVVGLANHTVLIARDGSEYPIADSGAPILDRDGEFLGVVLVFHDITEQYRTQQALAESETRFRSLFDGIKSGVAVYTARDDGNDFVFEDFNRAAERIERIDRAHVIGRRVTESFPGIREFGILEVFQRVWRTGRPEHFPIALYQDERISGWRENYVYKLPSGEIVAVYDDVTDRKRIEDELRHAQKMEAIGTLAGGIAHDFNNMLNAIMGYAELSILDTPPENPIRSNLEEIIKSSKRAAALVRQILTFSRQTDQEKKPMELQPVLKEALRLLRGVLPTTIEIRQHIKVNCRQILADVTQVHQVIMNLCTNSFHAMRESGGVLTVSLEEIELTPQQCRSHPGLLPGPYARLTVADTGCGMERAIMERIFDPYFTTKGQGEGTGLGLATVHGIVKGHKGEISVESAPGCGTTFTILLPVLTQPMKSAGQPNGKPAPVPRLNGRVLLVDDEKGLVDLGKTILTRLGCEVSAFTDSTEALREFTAHPDQYQVVITDQTMPKLTGMMLAEKLLAIRPEIQIILCTGYSDLVDEEKARAAGIRKFLLKPLSLEKLGRVLAGILN